MDATTEMILKSWSNPVANPRRLKALGQREGEKLWFHGAASASSKSDPHESSNIKKIS